MTKTQQKTLIVPEPGMLLTLTSRDWLYETCDMGILHDDICIVEEGTICIVVENMSTPDGTWTRLATLEAVGWLKFFDNDSFRVISC